MRRHHRTVLPAVKANVEQMEADNIAALAKQAQDALKAVDDHRDALAANEANMITAVKAMRGDGVKPSVIDEAMKPEEPVENIPIAE